MTYNDWRRWLPIAPVLHSPHLSEALLCISWGNYSDWVQMMLVFFFWSLQSREGEEISLEEQGPSETWRKQPWWNTLPALTWFIEPADSHCLNRSIILWWQREKKETVSWTDITVGCCSSGSNWAECGWNVNSFLVFRLIKLQKNRFSKKDERGVRYSSPSSSYCPSEMAVFNISKRVRAAARCS